MSIDTIDHTERIQRLAGDIADRYPDSETHAATQAIIAHLGALASALAASEARVDRLRRMVACCKWETERRVPPYIEIDWTGAELDAGIEPGDLAGPARDAAGGDVVTATEHPGDLDKGGAA